VKAKGAEVGVRTVAVPHLQTTVTLWTLRLASELVWNGDEAGSVPSPASTRSGVELTNYYHPITWFTFDVDASWSSARWAEFNPAGPFVPEAVGTVISAGATIADVHHTSGSLRWKYFGPRPLIEDKSQRSAPTSLFEVQAGYQVVKNLRVTVDVFNLFNSTAPDVTYYYTSRLPGEPLEGINDIEVHPTQARAVRVNLSVGF
jgi:outer membrane receptor protein involved in Fe transport